MVAVKNENNLFANRFLGPGMNVHRILYIFQHANKYAAATYCGIIESMGACHNSILEYF
jgi:hypothetical protein